MIILDTDVLIEIFDKHSKRGDEAIKTLAEAGEDIATTSINLHEILYGLKRYAKPIKEVLLLPIIEYTREDAQLSSELELKAEDLGAGVRRTDAMIAAIAVNRQARLYTFDLKHFSILERFGLQLLKS